MFSESCDRHGKKQCWVVPMAWMCKRVTCTIAQYLTACTTTCHCTLQRANSVCLFWKRSTRFFFFRGWTYSARSLVAEFPDLAARDYATLLPCESAATSLDDTGFAEEDVGLSCARLSLSVIRELRRVDRDLSMRRGCVSTWCQPNQPQTRRQL
jgi:hypothetical protein